MAESTPAPVEGKTCSKCGEFKPLEAYQVRREKRSGDGRRNDCKECCGKRVAAWQRANAEQRGVPPRVRAPDGYRTCSRCSEVKALGEFRTAEGRRRNRCTACADAVGRKKFPAAPQGYKWCTKCSECKPIDEFPKTKSGSGRGSWCKKCVARHNRERYTVPEIRADRRARHDRWADANPTYAAEWRQRNPERSRSKSRTAAARRRARQLDLPVEPYTLVQLLERDGTDCVLCGDPLDLVARYPDPLAATIEHLECISWPGSAGDVPTNCGVAHFRCNSQRCNRPHPAAAAKRAELLAAEAAAS